MTDREVRQLQECISVVEDNCERRIAEAVAAEREAISLAIATIAHKGNLTSAGETAFEVAKVLAIAAIRARSNQQEEKL